MYDRFTNKARTALRLAEKSAMTLKQNYVGTEHILLGLLKEKTGTAARVLIDNGAEEAKLTELIKDLIAPGYAITTKEKEGYSPRALKILEESHKQAQRFHSELTGTEHILLALIKEGENVAVRLLNTLGISVQKLYVDALIAMGEDGALYKEDLAPKKGKGKTKKQPRRWISLAGILPFLQGKEN